MTSSALTSSALAADDELLHDHPMSAHGGSIHRRPSSAARGRLASIGALVKPPPQLKFPSCRLVLMGMAFFAFLNIYCLRVNLSVALVDMVNASYIHDLEVKDAEDKVKANNETTLILEPACDDGHSHKNKTIKHGDFNWDMKQQSIILGSFFYGYITTQILGGVLAQKFGGKRLLLFGVAWTALLTILTPIATRAGGFAAIVAVRILEGIGEGVTYPSMHAMLSKWAPPHERSNMVTSVYAGAQVGTVLTMPISGLLCELSWDSVFYVFGALGLVWAVMWIFLTFDSPAQHPRIELAEREYIENSQGLVGTKKKSLRTPWRAIATSLPVVATAVAHFTNNWGYYTLLTCLPTYLKYILGFDIKQNGLISGLPYLCMWGFMILGGRGADVLISKHILSTTTVRKLANGIGFIGPGILLISTGYVGCNAVAAVVLIIFAVGLSGISMAGWAVNHLDLAPPYAGTLMGITNMIATIPGFLGPLVVGAFTNNNQTKAAWRSVFYVTGAVYLFGTIFFALFGSGQKQSWADQADSKTDEELDPVNSKKEKD